LIVYIIQIHYKAHYKELYTQRETVLNNELAGIKVVGYVKHNDNGGSNDEFTQDDNKYVEMGLSSNNIGATNTITATDQYTQPKKTNPINMTKTVSFSGNIPQHSTYATRTTATRKSPIPTIPTTINKNYSFQSTGLVSTHSTISAVGSTHGLSRQSEYRIISLIDLIPWYLKPAIPAVLNLLNSALRWASLVYIDASVAEMLISGLELTLSVVAARIFRGRMVAKSRWVGVSIVAVGVLIIERANSTKHDDDEVHRHTSSQVTIGVILIVLQSILSVLQDIGEEIFMQASAFPATKMLGMEGLYGFCIGLIIYLTIGEQLKIEDIDTTISILSENAKLRWWIVGLPLLFLITGIFNIKATEVTSAMSKLCAPSFVSLVQYLKSNTPKSSHLIDAARNVWKNLRTVLVWAIALCLYYIGNNGYGEAWRTPGSFYILLGFLVMSKFKTNASCCQFFFSMFIVNSYYKLSSTSQPLVLLFTIGINNRVDLSNAYCSRQLKK